MTTRRTMDAGVVSAAVALVLRLGVVAWAAPRFPPAADGRYYHLLAERIAHGHGYTWAWPDGVVTAAAHYPVGYPALLAVGYAFGASHVWGMVLGALFGALAAACAAKIAAPWGVRASFVAGLTVAIHPALFLYAPALMTEGIAGALLALAAWAALPGTWRRLAGAGLVLGVATLIRPQTIVLAPVLGWLAAARAPRSRRLGAAIVTTCVALACVAPWTLRNCREMRACALVSVNGGWNLLIGAQTDTGAWQEIRVPEPCRTVFDEAGKDACFAREARRAIVSDVPAAIARIPAKLAVTFDYFGAAPFYLHESNPSALDDRGKVVMGALDAITSRVVLLFALLGVLRRALASSAERGERGGRAGRGARWWAVLVIGGFALASACMRHAAPAYLGFVALAMAGAPYARREIALPWAAAVVAAVAATHAAFFGAGRYGLVVLPVVAAAGAVGLVAKGRTRCQDDAVDADQAIAGSSAGLQRLGREESPSTEEHDAG